jgi:hypothetical protein
VFKHIGSFLPHSQRKGQHGNACCKKIDKIEKQFKTFYKLLFFANLLLLPPNPVSSRVCNIKLFRSVINYIPASLVLHFQARLGSRSPIGVPLRKAPALPAHVRLGIDNMKLFGINLLNCFVS